MNCSPGHSGSVWSIPRHTQTHTHNHTHLPAHTLRRDAKALSVHPLSGHNLPCYRTTAMGERGGEEGPRAQQGMEGKGEVKEAGIGEVEGMRGERWWRAGSLGSPGHSRERM